MAKHNELGILGENLAKNFLKQEKFTFIEQNYRTKYGEIDLIMKKDNFLRFIEVKSIYVANLSFLTNERIQPEDNFTFTKWKRLQISVETYLKERGVSPSVRYQVDLACVYINTDTRQARVKFLENVSRE